MKRPPTACLRNTPFVTTTYTRNQQPYTDRLRSSQYTPALNRATARIIYLTCRHGSEHRLDQRNDCWSEFHRV